MILCLVLEGNIEDLGMSDNGELCCTISDDKSAKIFDVVNFGLYMSLTAIKMMKLFEIF